MYILNITRHIDTPDMRQSKTFVLSTNIDQITLEIEFSISIYRTTGDKWHSKTLFLAIFDPRSLIVKSVFDCCPSGVIDEYVKVTEKPFVLN